MKLFTLLVLVLVVLGVAWLLRPKHHHGHHGKHPWSPVHPMTAKQCEASCLSQYQSATGGPGGVTPAAKIALDECTLQCYPDSDPCDCIPDYTALVNSGVDESSAYTVYENCRDGSDAAGHSCAVPSGEIFGH
jgi:hypothetical protein